jgi:hypothetical protein
VPEKFGRGSAEVVAGGTVCACAGLAHATASPIATTRIAGNLIAVENTTQIDVPLQDDTGLQRKRNGRVNGACITEEFWTRKSQERETDLQIIEDERSDSRHCAFV